MVAGNKKDADSDPGLGVCGFDATEFVRDLFFFVIPSSKLVSFFSFLLQRAVGSISGECGRVLTTEFERTGLIDCRRGRHHRSAKFFMFC